MLREGDGPAAHSVPLAFGAAAEYLRERVNAPLTSGLLLSVYRVMTKGSQYEGCGFKTADNLLRAEDRLLFVPAAASVSREELERLLRRYPEEIAPLCGEEALRPILRFVLQFILIHPFPDGNGRMSELLLMYLLTRAGYADAFALPLDRLLLEEHPSYVRSILRSTGRVYSVGIRDSRPYEDFMLGLLGGLLRGAERCE